MAPVQLAGGTFDCMGPVSCALKEPVSGSAGKHGSAADRAFLRFQSRTPRVSSGPEMGRSEGNTDSPTRKALRTGVQFPYGADVVNPDRRGRLEAASPDPEKWSRLPFTPVWGRGWVCVEPT